MHSKPKRSRTEHWVFWRGYWHQVSLIQPRWQYDVSREPSSQNLQGADLVGWGKSSAGWYFGFKLHLTINYHGELLASGPSPDSAHDRNPVADMTKDLVGKLFGDWGYVLQEHDKLPHASAG